MKKRLLFAFVAAPFFTNCSHAIEPISTAPIPRMKAPLAVWGVIPYWGVYAPHEFVHVTGLGFEDGAKVFMGEYPCINTFFISDNSLRCEIPDVEETGDYSVTVINPDGTKRPIALTLDEQEAQRRYAIEDGEDPNEVGDGLVYFYYSKTSKSRLKAIKERLKEYEDVKLP
jgi:IPT/TIG domain